MPETIPPVNLLVQVRPERPDSVLIVARDGFNRSTYLGAMDSEALIKTARLFLAAAVGEDAVGLILDCIVIGVETADQDDASVKAAWDVVEAWKPPVEAVPA